DCYDRGKTDNCTSPRLFTCCHVCDRVRASTITRELHDCDLLSGLSQAAAVSAALRAPKPCPQVALPGSRVTLLIQVKERVARAKRALCATSRTKSTSAL